MRESIYEYSDRIDREYSEALDKIDALTAEMAQVRAELRESEGNNARLRQHIEQRANGADPLTRAIREEKIKLMEELKQARAQLAEARATVERQQPALSAIAELAKTDGGAWPRPEPVTFADKVLALACAGMGVDNA